MESTKKTKNLGLLTAQAFLKLLRSAKGDLSKYRYEVQQPVFISNTEMNKESYSCLVAAKYAAYPYPIKLGKGRFKTLTISWLDCPELDVAEAQFDQALYVDSHCSRITTKKLGEHNPRQPLVYL